MMKSIGEKVVKPIVEFCAGDCISALAISDGGDLVLTIKDFLTDFFIRGQTSGFQKQTTLKEGVEARGQGVRAPPPPEIKQVAEAMAETIASTTTSAKKAEEKIRRGHDLLTDQDWEEAIVTIKPGEDLIDLNSDAIPLTNSVDSSSVDLLGLDSPVDNSSFDLIGLDGPAGQKLEYDSSFDLIGLEGPVRKPDVGGDLDLLGQFARTGFDPFAPGRSKFLDAPPPWNVAASKPAATSQGAGDFDPNAPAPLKAGSETGKSNAPAAPLKAGTNAPAPSKADEFQSRLLDSLAGSLRY